MFLKKEKSESEEEPINKQEFEEKIIQALKTCYDPEIPVDIFELGLNLLKLKLIMKIM